MSPKIFSQEEKDAREREMLECAKAIIRTQGEANLTIDKLVKQLPYSKGTVYNHFKNKEDIILAISTDHMRSVANVFIRALSFDGNSREKALAVHIGSMLHTQANPQDFQISLTVKTAGCTMKGSGERQQNQQQTETSLVAPIFAHYKAAVDAGECSPPSHMGIEQLAFSCWSVDFGTQALLMGDFNDCTVRSSLNVERELVNSINLIHDGMQWKPLAKDFDWQATIERIKKEIFADEVAQIERLQAQHTTN